MEATVADELTEAERIARAEAALAHYEGPGQEAYDALTELLTDMRAYVDAPDLQKAVDESRTIWHRRQIVNGTIGTGVGSRSEVWRERLEVDNVVGEHWSAWPQELKDRIVADCVRTESEAMAAPLIAWSNRTGYGAAWNPEIGAVTFANDEARLEFSEAEMERTLRAAYVTVLDRYEEIETNHYVALLNEKVEQTQQLGYSCEVEPRVMTNETWTSVEPSDRSVTHYVGTWDDPLLATDAQGFADFVAIAEGLPPVRVNHTDKSWYRQEYIEQMNSVVDTRTLDYPTRRQFMTALADARTDAVNEALIGTRHAWDPRIALPVPIPAEPVLEISQAKWEAVEAAKRSVDPARVFAEVTAPDPWEAVNLAFPAAAPPAQVDTGTAPDATTYATAPAPEL
jgi:hypothetical protein